MTRKDFELIARTIHGLDLTSQTVRGYVAEKFADEIELHGGNENFNRERFLLACGTYDRVGH